MVSDVDQKVFWREKISLEAIDFLPLNVLHQTLFKFAELFLLSATLPTQIFLKEIAYILTCYQAFLKAQLFFIIFKAMEDNKVKTQILFACKFYLFPYLQLFIDKYKCIITK